MTGEDDRRSYASPPCFLHELSAAEGGVPGATDPVQARDVARWRKAERARLLADRAALSVAARKAAAEAVAAPLDRLLGDLAGKTVSAWWPIQSELDRLRGPVGDAAAKIVGRDFVDENIGIWSRMIPVLDSGEHCPTHLKAQKPG